MSNALEGKAALVTGGSRGIGAAVAVRLARDGADVMLTYREDTASAEAVAEQIRAMGRSAVVAQADSGDPGAVVAAVNRAAGEFGRLDIVVNNAGAFLLGALEDLGPEQFERTVAVNIRRRSWPRRRRSAIYPPVGGSSPSAATWPSARSSRASLCTRRARPRSPA
ncbi:hypothetical protein GCM10010435_67810 [Winogradskya consettensis]|uniref:Uncharacterized protein n=1 Tax=Winogradskya consettensis TaxID=113560 RepID=A0A919SJ87_9ACTN|nr:hypothetical protein Aco04nite_36960 [Actinoplanes consettensis]